MRFVKFVIVLIGTLGAFFVAAAIAVASRKISTYFGHPFTLDLFGILIMFLVFESLDRRLDI